MKNCRDCGKEKSGTENYCLNCGLCMPSPKRQVKISGIISFVMTILGLLGTHLYISSKYDTPNVETVAVDSENIHIEFVYSDLHQLVEENETDVSDFIASFRYYFEVALNSADFSYIEDYFKTGSQIQTDYLTDIERHGAMSDGYHYDFQSTTITGVEAIDQETLLVNTAEMFYFTSDDDALIYNKTKAYTVEIQGDDYYITNIKTITSDKVAS